MDLLSLLTGTLTSKKSVDEVSKKTGVQSKLVKKLIIAAIPILISYMTKNASSKKGATSLLGALDQHKDTNKTSDQLKNADLNDGAKIISKILGSDEQKAVTSISKEVGVAEDDVTKILNNIAPALLSGLSASTTSASKSSKSSGGLDLSDVMSLLGGSSSSKKSSNSTTDLLSSLLGGSSSSSKKKSSSSADLVSSLLGGGSSSSSDGTELLGLLTSLMK